MSNTFFLLFTAAIFIFAIGKSIYYFLEKNKILKICRHTNSIELKNISGTIFTNEGTFKKKYEWCSFDILINDNSIFLFSKGFQCNSFQSIQSFVFQFQQEKYQKANSAEGV